MRIPFTKMQGAGNDFVVLDETQTHYGLSAAQYRFLADRHFGVGADQILTVRASSTPGVDFSYLIHNADGGEVEHCGNGARCFLAFVRRQGLTTKDQVTVQTMNRVLQLQMQPDGRVTVDMQAPDFDLSRLPFNNKGQHCELIGSWLYWPLALDIQAQEAIVKVALVSMGNPHAVTLVDDVDTAPVLSYGPLIQSLSAFPSGVNVGFMQVVDRSHIRLRVYERGAGETLACGTGACAAVVAGIRTGLLDATVDVQTHGGTLTIGWQGERTPVLLTGPATVVFDGDIELLN
ncbi:diaminopimelate epimerase [Rhodoferax antarcticus]|uniref:Diaminopimelate epimerase n=1 Tax=Rhodoferax antarcticus ANT.BR TaxID=1111071 RepID=A0A1Q8YJN1_9BURK|nr:diaminopimelate epimerase [Rhodoferax antarcticus]APW47725.1 diaminopimelate epimerase [Rhodoferax antarcticus]MCW2312551.1 diaminopimelate epimerase [Rhodoferax antarcticus]OLP08264.1 diaminopimelate epimerase [Rhodoferax antarcticus ANT.BR]